METAVLRRCIQPHHGTQSAYLSVMHHDRIDPVSQQLLYDFLNLEVAAVQGHALLWMKVQTHANSCALISQDFPRDEHRVVVRHHAPGKNEWMGAESSIGHAEQVKG
jgi:hypothetical protein